MVPAHRGAGRGRRFRRVRLGRLGRRLGARRRQPRGAPRQGRRPKSRGRRPKSQVSRGRRPIRRGRRVGARAHAQTRQDAGGAAFPLADALALVPLRRAARPRGQGRGREIPGARRRGRVDPLQLVVEKFAVVAGEDSRERQRQGGRVGGVGGGARALVGGVRRGEVRGGADEEAASQVSDHDERAPFARRPRHRRRHTERRPRAPRRRRVARGDFTRHGTLQARGQGAHGLEDAELEDDAVRRRRLRREDSQDEPVERVEPGVQRSLLLHRRHRERRAHAAGESAREEREGRGEDYGRRRDTAQRRHQSREHDGIVRAHRVQDGRDHRGDEVPRGDGVRRRDGGGVGVRGGSLEGGGGARGRRARERLGGG
mmetsp:Transcript_12556/g.45149  ORF Transcript_12556/g.45149 Transcript_12556/m.45149 type:complete len:372 (+) Transcript_12556:3673-4788(+)